MNEARELRKSQFTQRLLVLYSYWTVRGTPFEILAVGRRMNHDRYSSTQTNNHDGRYSEKRAVLPDRGFGHRRGRDGRYMGMGFRFPSAGGLAGDLGRDADSGSAAVPGPRQMWRVRPGRNFD